MGNLRDKLAKLADRWEREAALHPSEMAAIEIHECSLALRAALDAAPVERSEEPSGMRVRHLAGFPTIDGPCSRSDWHPDSECPSDAAPVERSESKGEPHRDDTRGGPGSCACGHSPLRHDVGGCVVSECPCANYCPPPGWRPDPDGRDAAERARRSAAAEGSEEPERCACGHSRALHEHETGRCWYLMGDVYCHCQRYQPTGRSPGPAPRGAP